MSTQQEPPKGITAPGRPIKRKGDPMVCDCTIEHLKIIPATKPHPQSVPLQYRLNAPKCPEASQIFGCIKIPLSSPTIFSWT